MFKWVRVTENQYIGFWALGLLLFVIQEIPYIVMPLVRLDSNPVMNMRESNMALEICEKVLGSLCIALMIFVVRKDMPFFSVGSGICKGAFYIALLVLLLNFIGWGLYFSGRQSKLIILLFIVIMPPLYYSFIGLWRQNGLLFILGLIFEAVHFIHVYGNLKE